MPITGPRTNVTQVQRLLAYNYDGRADLQTYVDSASVIVDRAVNLAAERGVSLLATEQELMERWLACHLYTKMDPLYASKSTAGASGSFVASKNEPERYKEGACNIDYSGALRIILNRQVARAFWLGTP
jgi:hypothetical protein